MQTGGHAGEAATAVFSMGPLSVVLQRMVQEY